MQNKNLKGIVLAGGKGTRLYPLTKAISKQLLPVYRLPMILYPLMTLRDLGVQEILVITAPDQQDHFKAALSDVTDVKLSFAVQQKPNGLAEAFIIAEQWLDGSDAVLILGDNIFINAKPILREHRNNIFTFRVKDPSRYGVVKTKGVHRDEIGEIVEKPKNTFVSNEAVVGLYIFSNKVCEMAKTLTPSKERKELEIVDLIKVMNDIEGVYVSKLDGFWFDAGTHDDLLDCANFIRAIEQRSSGEYNLNI